MTTDSKHDRILVGPRVGAVILAGGLARRMGGQDKGLVELAGKPMVQYTLDTIQPLVDTCIINANRNLEAYRSLGADVVSDNLPGHLGPLAGLSAAMDVLDTDYVFMCPCDSPFLQAGLFNTLLAACISKGADIAVPHDGERLQPVFFIVHRRAKSSLDAFLAAGERKIDRWFTLLTQTTVPAYEYADSFRNINTEQECLDAENVLLR